jgi:acyl carrier protein
MNKNTMLQVQEIFRDVFDDKKLLLTPETNSSTIPDWDSLAHMSLVTAIEREFQIRFALGELQALKNVGDMIQLIDKKRK